jgi:hypothetical protein
MKLHHQFIHIQMLLKLEIVPTAIDNREVGITQAAVDICTSSSSSVDSSMSYFAITHCSFFPFSKELSTDDDDDVQISTAAWVIPTSLLSIAVGTISYNAIKSYYDISRNTQH